MKKLTILVSGVLVALMVFTSTKSVAQDATPTPFKPYFGVGPFFTAGATVFAGEVPEGFKTGMQFAFTGGVLGLYELSNTFGVTLGLGYESRPMYMREEESASNGEWTYKLSYITIQPGVKFGAFMVGISIAMPNTAKGTFNRTAAPEVSTEGDLVKDDLGTLIDFRLGGLIPLTHGVSSDLNFFVQAAYPLTDAIKDYRDPVNNPLTPTRGTATPTLQGGLCYTFFLGR